MRNERLVGHFAHFKASAEEVSGSKDDRVAAMRPHLDSLYFSLGGEVMAPLVMATSNRADVHVVDVDLTDDNVEIGGSKSKPMIKVTMPVEHNFGSGKELESTLEEIDAQTSTHPFLFINVKASKNGEPLEGSVFEHLSDVTFTVRPEVFRDLADDEHEEPVDAELLENTPNEKKPEGITGTAPASSESEGNNGGGESGGGDQPNQEKTDMTDGTSKQASASTDTITNTGGADADDTAQKMADRNYHAPERLPNETDAEYEARLNAQGHIVNPPEEVNDGKGAPADLGSMGDKTNNNVPAGAGPDSPAAEEPAPNSPQAPKKSGKPVLRR